MCVVSEESKVRKKILIGAAVASTFLFGACQKSDSTSTTKSAALASGKIDSSSSIRVSQTNASSTSSENKKRQTDQKNEIQNSLTNEELAIVLLLSSNIQNQPVDAVLSDYINAYSEDTGYGSKIQLSKRLLPDIIVSFSSMGSTQKVHFDEDIITVTSYSNSGEKSEERFSKKELINEFGKYQEQLTVLVRKIENYSPLAKHSEKSEDNSDTTVDTKNITSQQFKDWVSAVLDKQFTLGRSSFLYDLSIENHEG